MCGTCATSQGLNANGVASTAVRTSSGRAQWWAQTSSARGFTSARMRAVNTGQISFSTIPESSMAVGVPAKVRPAPPEAADWIRFGVGEYLHNSTRYRDQLRRLD